MTGLTEGRVVHFVMPDGRHRAAIITEVVSPGTGHCGLSVFLAPDDPEQHVATFPQPQMVMPVRAFYGESGEHVGTWHWPERA